MEPRMLIAETAWGYVLRQDDWLGRHAVALERLVSGLGVACLAAAAGFWFLPGATLEAPVLPLKLVLTVTLLSLALTAAFFARRGLGQEVEIDLEARELRLVTVNGRHERRPDLRREFGQIESVFIAPDRHGHGRLCARLRGEKQPVLIGSAALGVLEHLNDSLCEDMALGRASARMAGRSIIDRLATRLA